MPNLKRYDRVWQGMCDLVTEMMDRGERDLSRVVRLIEAEWRSMDVSPVRGVSFGKTRTFPRAALFGGRRDVLMRVLVDACTPATGMVVELGSGWGNNLVDLYLWGGARVPYYALEPTQSGRACTELLAGLDPDIDLRALTFDYEHPRYPLPTGNRHVVVFTSHSIEQIPELPRAAITGLFGLGASLTVVHLEPIGWQMHSAGEAARARGHALGRKYNENLWALLAELADAGEIEIETVVPDIIGHKLRTPSTLVVWRRGAPDVA